MGAWLAFFMLCYDVLSIRMLCIERGMVCLLMVTIGMCSRFRHWRGDQLDAVTRWSTGQVLENAMCNVAANHGEGEAMAAVQRLDWNEPQAAACEVWTFSIGFEPKHLIRALGRHFLCLLNIQIQRMSEVRGGQLFW
jgi:hypothetical protein